MWTIPRENRAHSAQNITAWEQRQLRMSDGSYIILKETLLCIACNRRARSVRLVSTKTQHDSTSSSMKRIPYVSTLESIHHHFSLESIHHHLSDKVTSLA